MIIRRLQAGGGNGRLMDPVGPIGHPGIRVDSDSDGDFQGVEIKRIGEIQAFIYGCPGFTGSAQHQKSHAVDVVIGKQPSRPLDLAGIDDFRQLRAEQIPLPALLG